MDVQQTAGSWPDSGTWPHPLVGDAEARDRNSRPARLSVLVVDDNAGNRLACARWLEMKGGFRVEVAANGKEALARVAGEAFDLVILDVMMPMMGGLEVLRQLRETYTPDELPVVMATAKNQSADVVKAFELGANDYLTKPIDFPVALARIQAQLRSKRPAAAEAGTAGLNVISPRQIKPGVVLEGKYRLDKLIGAGSNGEVFRATHMSLNREVAIKVLRTHLRNGEDALEHFKHEGISACRVDHPNAVTVLDFTATSGGVVFLVMELLRGHTVAEEIRRLGRLSPSRCAQIALPICDVLTETHSLGIIHRDVKPQNSFLHQSRRGEIVKVLDFGLAKLLEQASQNDDPTIDSLAGTLGYVAPERVSAAPYDGRVDVYSLGVMIYEMLTGQLPFATPDNNPVRLMMMHVHQKPARLRKLVPDLDPVIEEAVLWSLEKDPHKRPTAAKFKEEFARAVGVTPDDDQPSLDDQSGFTLRAALERELGF